MPRLPVIVTNDDGIGSEGLWHLAAAAAQAGFDVVVAAPLGEASGTGSAMKAVQTDGRILVQRRELPEPAAGIPAFAIDATPAFIVFAAVRGGFGVQPRYVLSGINRGANTGRAVLHSGTVGAAMTANGYDLASAAFSLDVKEDGQAPEWATAARVADQVFPALPKVPRGVVLNVNVPNVAPGELTGIMPARLASPGAVQTTMQMAEGYLKTNIPGSPQQPEAGTDSAALAAGYASLTALRPVCEVPIEGLPWTGSGPAA